jgi:hypothetical protein
MSVFASLIPNLWGVLDSLNGASNSTAFTLVSGKTAKFFCVQSGLWDVMLGG